MLLDLRDYESSGNYSRYPGMIVRTDMPELFGCFAPLQDEFGRVGLWPDASTLYSCFRAEMLDSSLQNETLMELLPMEEVRMHMLRES